MLCASCVLILLYLAYDMSTHMEKTIPKTVRYFGFSALGGSLIMASFAAFDFIAVWYPISWEPWYCTLIFAVSPTSVVIAKVSMWWFFLGLSLPSLSLSRVFCFNVALATCTQRALKTSLNEYGPQQKNMQTIHTPPPHPHKAIHLHGLNVGRRVAEFLSRPSLALSLSL